MQRNSLISFFLTESLGAPVSMREILFYKGGFEISDFHVSNVPPCKTTNAFFAEDITCKATSRSILQHRMEIESIHIKNILLGIEFFTPSGDQNNWTLLLTNHRGKKKNSRPYLIRTIIFDNVHIAITDAEGRIKKVPTIAHLEFHNISDESGFPIEEIEKAIFQSMLQTLFRQLGIKTIMKMLDPYSIPKIFRFPFPLIGKSSSHPESDLSKHLR
jgi:hypothetical protein